MNYEFTPDAPASQTVIPYFEDARSSDGWEGHASHKNADRLRDEMIVELNRLGASITKMQTGIFKIDRRERSGLRLEFLMAGAPGRIMLASLPVKHLKNRPDSLKMLYYVSRNVFRGMWLLQQLAPGTTTLLPFLLVGGDHTLSEVWSEKTNLGLLLPPGDVEFVEGEIIK